MREPTAYVYATLAVYIGVAGSAASAIEITSDRMIVP
jgi:hypothetical protein